MNALKYNIATIGYVHTSYGDRNISNVKSDIDEWADHWVMYGISGIFLDEMSHEGDKLPYYEEIYAYVLGKSGLKEVFGNPGT